MFGESEAEAGWLVVQEKQGKGCSLPSCGLQMHLLFCPPSTNFYAARIGKEKFNCHCQGGDLTQKQIGAPSPIQFMFNKEEQGKKVRKR